ncbi:MAG TPA: hypothetical protein DD727_04650 [Clostridiales bacterium]|nr:hypothetical protein [Clostridiales bacterium]
MKKNYRAAIIGCGMIAAEHAKMYAEHEQTELIALADIHPDHLKKFSEKWGIPGQSTYTDHISLLKNEKIDLVSVCTWHGSHAEISIDCAEKGIPGIICEKPMATSLGEAKKMLLAAKNNKVKLTVEHTRRYKYDSIKARELIGSGVIGKVQAIHVRTQGGMLNWATHLIDQVRYLLGDPEMEWTFGQIERKTDRYERLEPAEDRAMGIICFSNGARMILESDLPKPGLESGNNKPVVYGTTGQIFVGPKLRMLNGEGWHEYEPPMESERGGLLAHTDELIHWMEGDTDSHRCSGEQAIKDIEIMMSIYESARSKNIVLSPLLVRDNPLKEMLKNGDLPVMIPGEYDFRYPYWE